MNKLYMNLAKEMREAAAKQLEIVVEEKIQITESEEVIVEEIPTPVQEFALSKAADDGKDS